MMGSFDRGRHWVHRGFTLVELLVAMAVLGLLVVMLAQVVTLTGQAISVNAKKLDAAGQARLVFDRLAADLAACPSRPDLKMLFTKNFGNDNLQFYSEINGYTQSTDSTVIRGLAAIGYQIPTNALIAGGPLYQLERGATGTAWQVGGGDSPLNFYGLPVPKDADYDVLANGVFRIEICYLLNSNAGNSGAFSNSNGSTLTGADATTDYSNVAAIVVALGVLDTASRQILSVGTNTTTTNSQLQKLTGALKDSIEGQDPLQEWTQDMTQTGFASGVPAHALQGVRLYQRTFNVP